MQVTHLDVRQPDVYDNDYAFYDDLVILVEERWDQEVEQEEKAAA